MEVEEENTISFLEVLIRKNVDGLLGHQEYRENTHTERYLHGDSHHYPTHKLGVTNTLVTCAVRLSDDEHIEKELHHLYKFFINNGYQERQIKHVIKKVQDGPR